MAIWPRGGAKSTSAELACAALGARGIRKYAIYVCETQEQADDHISNIADLLEGATVETYYPDMADRMVGKFGNVKGWRRSRLRTANGFTVDALGLDVKARGIKMEDQRPDLIIIDDIDGEEDSPLTIRKKIRTLTKKLLPAGSNDMAVLAVQNLIHPDSIFSQLVDGRADFMHGRIISGPFPAIVGLTYEQGADGKFVITGGTPTWAGQDLIACQAMINRYGITAFLTESQQEVEPPSGGMFDHLTYIRVPRSEVPPLVDIQVWIDPAVTESDQSDACGIAADGIAEATRDAKGKIVAPGIIYRLYFWEQRTSPLKAMMRGLAKAVELKASCVGIETDQGGDTWRSVYTQAWAALVASADYPEITAETHRPPLRYARAGSVGSKTHRASQMLAKYELGRFRHVVGTTDALERALKRFPVTKPFDLVDASYWAQNGVDTRMGSHVAFVKLDKPAEEQAAEKMIEADRRAALTDDDLEFEDDE